MNGIAKGVITSVAIAAVLGIGSLINELNAWDGELAEAKQEADEKIRAVESKSDTNAKNVGAVKGVLLDMQRQSLSREIYELERTRDQAPESFTDRDELYLMERQEELEGVRQKIEQAEAAQ